MNFIIMALAAALAVGGPPMKLDSGWRIQVTRDAMTDAVQAAAERRGQGVVLVLWCDTENNTSFRAEVRLEDYLGSDDERVIAYRFDQSSPVIERWLVTTKGQGTTVYPNLSQAEKFTAALFNSARLAVQSDTYERNARPVVRALDVGGAAEVAALMRPYCMVPKVAN